MHRRYFKSEFDQWGVELSMSTRHYKSTVLCCAFSFPFLSVTRQTYQRTVPPLVMRSLKCVSFLLWMVILLATIGSFGTTAHRELLMATRGVETKLVRTVRAGITCNYFMKCTIQGSCLIKLLLIRRSSLLRRPT